MDDSEIKNNSDKNKMVEPESKLKKILSYLNSGFMLLVVGSLITSFLVPSFQRQQEIRSQEKALKQEALAQFLLYTNSIWKEYYLMFPLIQEQEIDKETYNLYLSKISDVKLERYNSYAKIKALAIVFRDAQIETESEVEDVLKNYAIEVNQVSSDIDSWLRHLYCAPNKCVFNQAINPQFSSYGEYQKLSSRMQENQLTSQTVAQAIVTSISE